MEELDDVNVLVPTLDEDVKSALRNLQEPITYFGEGPVERRERLIKLVNENENIRQSFLSQQGEKEQEQQPDKEDVENGEFYTPGTDELLHARLNIADYSLHRASLRHKTQLANYRTYDPIAGLKKRRNYYGEIKDNMDIEGSQLVSNRFTAAVKFSTDGQSIAAGSWNGGIYLYDANTLDLKNDVPDLQSGKVCTLDFNPLDSMLLATGGSNGLIKLIRLSEGKPSISTLSGHQKRISSLQFHPCGKYLATGSYDLTWRLWDITTGKELYFQEGHSKEVSSVRIHPDGSLIASGGLDAIIRLWDLRTGKSVSVLNKNGHVKSIHAMDWRPSGYQLISGGADNNLKVWDIRQGDSPIATTVLDHSKVIADISVANNDLYFATCGYDGYMNVLSCDGLATVRKFKSVDKLMCCDISPNCAQIITGGWDRSINLYSK